MVSQPCMGKGISCMSERAVFPETQVARLCHSALGAHIPIFAMKSCLLSWADAASWMAELRADLQQPDLQGLQPSRIFPLQKEQLLRSH